MIKNHSFCLRKLKFIAVFLLFYPISLLSIQASEKSDMSNVVSNTAQQTSGILSVKKVNPTTVDVLFSNNQRRTIDFYGENIFRVFQDNSGGIIRDPEAKPEAQILVDRSANSAAVQIQLQQMQGFQKLQIYTDRNAGDSHHACHLFGSKHAVNTADAFPNSA